MKRALLPFAVVIGVLAAAGARAQECGGDFSAWLNGVERQAAQSGVGSRGIRFLSQAQIDRKVLSRDRAQGVFTQDFLTFSGRMVNSYRLKNGAALMKKYASVFRRAQSEFGVPAPVITAFWALETDFGAVQGDFSTLDALATLAYDCRRPQLFRPQLIALAQLVDLRVLPEDVQGAWAGEIGQVQMLPEDYLNYGRDGDGDGRVDLRNDPADVILTAGNFIRSLGWRPGEPWLEEVRIPSNLPWHQTGRVNRLPRSQWAAWGVKKRDGSALEDDSLPAALVLPMGRKGPAFLAFPNYDVYLEWNQSFVYTMTAAYLATRLAGAPRYDSGDPDPGLSPRQMRALQQKLEARGHDVGKIDGVLGAGTRAAVRIEQDRLGLPADGWPTSELLARL